MFFKNLIAYKIVRELDTTPEKLNEQLEEFKTKELGSQQLSNIGWAKPMGKHGKMLTHVIEKDVLICIKENKKIIPSSVIKERLEEKVEEIELANDRRLKKAEKDVLKEEIISQLLPRAFVKSSLTYAWIDFDTGMFYVDAGGYNKAEQLISLLRKTLGSLPLVPVTLNDDINTVMTNWVKESQFPNNIEMEDEIELKAITDGLSGVITCKKEDLTDEKIKAHLENDEKEVTKLSLSWNDSLSFVFSESGIIKRIKFSDVHSEEGQDAGDFASSFDADFGIMKGEFKKFIPELFLAFNGISES